MLEAFTYREDAAAVVGLLQLGRHAGGLSGASFGPVGVAHGEDGEGQVGSKQRWSCLGQRLMGVLMRAEPGVQAVGWGGSRRANESEMTPSVTVCPQAADGAPPVQQPRHRQHAESNRETF